MIEDDHSLTQAFKGDTDGDNLVMPEMINIKSSGIRCSARVASQPQTKYNTALVEQLQDKEGTGIDTKRSKSKFYWNNNQFQRTIYYPSSNLPKLPINKGFTITNLFSRMVASKVCLTKQH